ncbi:MAG: signal peptidase II [Deltaproteobacteria bacterium]
MKSKYILLISLAGFTVVLDQITKLLMTGLLELHQAMEIVPNFFNFTYVRNTGAAFGLLSKAPESFRVPFFIIIPLVALTVIILIFKKTKETELLMITSLSLILGGAIGNFIDRVRFGYVVDFVDLHWFNKYHWPAFNIADMAIVIGVALLIFYTLVDKR